MHDFGADSLGRDHLYTADVVCKHAYWPILCTILGLVDKRLNWQRKSFKAQNSFIFLLWIFVQKDALPALCESFFGYVQSPWRVQQSVPSGTAHLFSDKILGLAVEHHAWQG